MYYLLEIWKDGNCCIASALTREHAQELAEETQAEYYAVTEAAGLIPDLRITIHQCAQAIEFKPKGDQNASTKS